MSTIGSTQFQEAKRIQQSFLAGIEKKSLFWRLLARQNTFLDQL